jgi:hypothetical protein
MFRTFTLPRTRLWTELESFLILCEIFGFYNVVTANTYLVMLHGNVFLYRLRDLEDKATRDLCQCHLQKYTAEVKTLLAKVTFFKHQTISPRLRRNSVA